MDRLRITGAHLAAELWFTGWVAISAISMAGDFTGTLVTYVAMLVKTLWRVLILTIVLGFETLVSIVRYLWAPRFWKKRRNEMSELPSPLFDAAIVATLVVFSVLANATL